MPPLDLDAPQWGEYVWHAFTDDPTIEAQSIAHRDRIEELIRRHLRKLDLSRARILEVAAYRHYTAHLVAAAHGSACVVTDIAPASLRNGSELARARGTTAEVARVVADFHDLPFADGYFDAVFIASAVHHTLRPEQVLRELLRVVRAGGIVMLENEPCARVFCFHAFVCNEAGSLTPWEAAARAAGLLPTLSAPFWGARAEALFGMVENAKIPLSLFLDTLAEGGATLERDLFEHAVIGSIERELLALPGRGKARRIAVAALLRSIVERAREGFSERERLLGYRLPTECEVHALALRTANLLDLREEAESAAQWQAEMFGAALRIVVRRDANAAPRADAMFRRAMVVDADGLVRERDAGGSIAGRLGTPLLPDLYASASAAEMAPWFPENDWEWVVEHHGGRSMINRGASGAVRIPAQPAPAILLIRYYAVVGDGAPYHVRVVANGRVLDDQLVVLQETRLVRALVPAGCAVITIELAEREAIAASAVRQIRIGVLQLLAAD